MKKPPPYIVLQNRLVSISFVFVVTIIDARKIQNRDNYIRLKLYAEMNRFYSRKFYRDFFPLLLMAYTDVPGHCKVSR